MLHFEEPRPGVDDLYVAQNLRVDDHIEVLLATGEDPTVALLRRESQPGARTYVVTAPGSEHPMALFGVIPWDENLASAWFLATPEVEKHSKSLLRDIPPYVEELSAPFQGLVAFMWEGNPMHRKWAEALGFVHMPEGDTSVRGARFLRIFRPTR